MTSPTPHLIAIRSNKHIDSSDIDEQRAAFREACRAMRKFVSPVLKPSNSLFQRIDKLRGLCHLQNDDRVVVEVLAARLVAQIDSYAAPGRYDDLLIAAGVQIVSGGLTLGDDESDRVRIVEGEIDAIPGARVIVHAGHSIVMSDSHLPGLVHLDGRDSAADDIDSLAIRNSGGQVNVELPYGTAPAEEVELFDSVNDPWRPTLVYSDRLKAHPDQIVEPSTLAATAYPASTYRPLLPAAALDRGLISDVQFEAIVYGLQATDRYLDGSPSGDEWAKIPRAGAINGDGTGVGKSNTACGMIIDQWNRGSRRHIIVVERETHHRHMQEAWTMLGGRERDIVWHGSYEAKAELPDRDVVIVTSYALIRNDDRFKALLDWAGSRGDFHGFLIFDEAQNMRNAVEDEAEEASRGGWGKNNQSQQGIRGVEIQEALPDARVIYMSATMATDVFNLGYAPRLGLWGRNAPFSSLSHFLDAMKHLDDAGLEQVAIDLKSAGRYCSRNMSYDGVEYDELEHKMTPRQRQSFDAIVRGWQEVDSIMEKAAEICGGRRPVEERRSMMIASRTTNKALKRMAIEQALSSFVCDTLFEDIHREIARGNAPVIQIAMTGAARLEKIAAGRSYVPEEDFYEKDILQRIDRIMNVHDMEMVPQIDEKTGKPKLDGQGEPLMTAAYLLDEDGNRIENVEALALREKLVTVVRDLSPRHGILDRLYEEFPVGMIAEMTGRKYRALPDRKNGSVVGWHIEERRNGDKDADVDAFLRGDKKILVFSLAAGGTGRSYHASRAFINQDRRVHYLVELGRRADQSVQGTGRTHRSGQIVAPIVRVVRCDIPAHMIYASRTLEKISKMGALSSGHQQAKTNGIFQQRIPLRGKYAQRGWLRTIKDVRDGKVGTMTYASMIRDLDLTPNTTVLDSVTKKKRKMTADETVKQMEDSNRRLYNLDLMLDRIAMMTDSDQRALVDALIVHTEAEISEAVRKGEYNQGLETIRATSIKLVDERKVVNPSGAATSYVRLRRHDEIKPITFMKASMMAVQARKVRENRALFLRHRVSGRVMLAITGENSTGIVETFSPRGSDTRSIEMLRHEPWSLIPDLFEAERLWDLEKERLDMKGVSDIHMLTGSLLFNWDKLPQQSVGLQRCKTDDGRVFVGRVISPTHLRATLKGIGIQSGYKPLQISMMLGKVDQGAEIALDNGWRVVGSGGAQKGYRLLVPDEEQTGQQRNEMRQLGIEVHDTPLGHDLEIPRADAVSIIQNLSVGVEMTLEGVATVQTVVPAAANAGIPSLAA